MPSFRVILLSTLVSGILAAPLIPYSETREQAASLFHENPRTSLETRNEELSDNFADTQSRSTGIRAEIIAKNTGNGVYSRGTETSENTQDFDPRELKEVSEPDPTYRRHEVEEVNNLQTRSFEVDGDFANIEGRKDKPTQGGSNGRPPTQGGSTGRPSTQGGSTGRPSTQGGSTGRPSTQGGSNGRPSTQGGSNASSRDASARARVDKEMGEINDIKNKQREQERAGKVKEDHERQEIEEARRREDEATNPRDKAAAKADKEKEQAELNDVKNQNQREKERLQNEMIKEKQELEDAKRAAQTGNANSRVVDAGDSGSLGNPRVPTKQSETFDNISANKSPEFQSKGSDDDYARRRAVENERMRNTYFAKNSCSDRIKYLQGERQQQLETMNQAQQEKQQSQVRVSQLQQQKVNGHDNDSIEQQIRTEERRQQDADRRMNEAQNRQRNGEQLIKADQNCHSQQGPLITTEQGRKKQGR